MKKKLDKDFLKKYCNWNALETIFLSFDIDWAPDYMLEDLTNLLGNTKATFMLTHKSDMSTEIQKSFSTGTHPNLCKGSSQGEDITQCIDFFKKNKLSDLKLNRFHVLGFSYRDLVSLSEEGLELDSSSLFLNHHYLLPHYQEELNIINAPYFWEDGMRLNNKVDYEDEYIDFNCPGLKIFDFHPIDIYLNTYSIDHRNSFKNSVKSVSEASKNHSETFINKSIYGTRDILKKLLTMRNQGKFIVEDLSFLNSTFRETL